jgi:hypothetical protein
MSIRPNIDQVILDTLDGSSEPILVAPEKAKLMGIVDDIFNLPTTSPHGTPIAVWT